MLRLLWACVQAEEAANELRSRLARAEAKCKVNLGEASESQAALAATQAELQQLQFAVAVALKARPARRLHHGLRVGRSAPAQGNGR